jgi:hyaluronate lyase
MKVRAAEFERLRKRRLLMLTVAPDEAEAPEVKAALVVLERTARRYQKTMDRTARHGVLWRNLAKLNPFSNAISSQYLQLSVMAQAWASPGQDLHGDRSLLRDIKWGLEWLHANQFNANTKERGNWYDFEIDAPGCLTDTLILLGDQLSREQKQRYLAPVQKFDANADVIHTAPGQSATSTGSNRTDKAMVDLCAGILLQEEEIVWKAVAAIRSVFRTVREGDGFYEDGSFVFHGFFPYTGNYGLVLLSDVADAFFLLRGTRWDFTARHKAMAAEWAMKSFTPLVYEGGMMDMVRGRLISFSSSPSHAVGHRTIAAMLRLSQSLSKADANVIRARIKGWWNRGTARHYTDGLTLDLICEARRLRDARKPAPDVPKAVSKVFASMDRAVHLRRSFGAGISMHSTRIQNYESINGNDLDGWHTSDGMLYLYDADLLQFDGNFWPTVDPERLPGTTAIAGSHPPEGQFGGSAAVGGVSLDEYSAVMMQLNVFQGRLQAKKSWFLFDEEVVALGTDIRCTVPSKHVETIVENRKLTSIRTRRLVRDPRGGWANLPASASAPAIGYVFLGRTKVKARRARRVGAWHDIDSGLPREKLSATYQTMWIDHGVKPKRSDYGYVLLPGTDAGRTAAHAAKPAVRVLENSAKAQAVEHEALGITAVSLWEPGASVAGISANAVCSVIVRRANGVVSIAVSDPTQQALRPIRLTIDTAAGKTIEADDRIRVIRRRQPLTLAVRVKDAAGKSIRASFRCPG